MRERRTASRYRLPLHVSIKRVPASEQSDVLYGLARDISTSGVYFTSQEHLAVGDKFEFSVNLPMEGVHKEEVVVEVQARVVRVEQKRGNGTQHWGVAAVIEAYKVIQTKIGTF